MCDVPETVSDLRSESCVMSAMFARYIYTQSSRPSKPGQYEERWADWLTAKLLTLTSTVILGSESQGAHDYILMPGGLGSLQTPLPGGQSQMVSDGLSRRGPRGEQSVGHPNSCFLSLALPCHLFGLSLIFVAERHGQFRGHT
jgi:hypothetical protein